MKKKNLILPSVIFAVSVVLIVVMLLFTTSFLFYYNLNRLDKKGYEGIVNCRKVTELAYKINPSYSNLQACQDTYFYRLYFDPCGYTDIVLDANSMPKDFYAKSVKYSKEMYHFYLTNKDAYSGSKDSNSYLDIGYMSYDHAIASSLSDYAISLYLNGEKEESRKIIDEYFERTEKSEADSVTMNMAYMHNYVYTLHRLEKDRDYQEWIVETEKKFTALHYKIVSDIDGKPENIFAKSEFYIPFDWQK